jgi:N-acetylmuramoyl-L-alanine amidase
MYRAGWLMKIVVYIVSLAVVMGSPFFAFADLRVDQSRRDQQCLALAMYWEARGEGDSGMLAVGFVVKNRASHPDFPNRVCQVIRQGGERPPCQFSWWCDGRSDRPTDLGLWRDALRLADDVLARRERDLTRGALFFHHVRLKNAWHRRRPKTARIGNHMFYR